MKIKLLVCLLIFSLLLRLWLSVSIYSGDLNNHMIWAAGILDGGAVGAYDREYPGVMKPTYPPLSLLNFITGEWLYRQSMSLTNTLNRSISIFPSKLIWIMEDQDYRPAFQKIISIVCDLGIGILIYRLTRNIFAAAFYLLNPTVWYVSAVWGQIESVPLFFLFLAYWYLWRRRSWPSHFFMVAALLTKQTTIIFFPVHLLWSWYRLGVKKTIFGLLLQFFVFCLLYSVFWANPISTYIDRLNTGSGSVWITDHAFNPWIWVSHLQKIPDFSYRLTSQVIFAILAIVIIIKLAFSKFSQPLIFLGSGLLAAVAFLSLTRMHERYLAPFIPFLAVSLPKFKYLWVVYVLVSAVHLANLYHDWWFPRIPSLVTWLSSWNTVQILTGILTFGTIVIFYKFLTYAPDKP